MFFKQHVFFWSYVLLIRTMALLTNTPTATFTHIMFAKCYFVILVPDHLIIEAHDRTYLFQTVKRSNGQTVKKLFCDYNHVNSSISRMIESLLQSYYARDKYSEAVSRSRCSTSLSKRRAGRDWRTLNRNNRSLDPETIDFIIVSVCRLGEIEYYRSVEEAPCLKLNLGKNAIESPGRSFLTVSTVLRT